MDQLNSESTGSSNDLFRFRLRRSRSQHQVLRRQPSNSILRPAWWKFLLLLAAFMLVLLPSKMRLISRRPFELESERTPHLVAVVDVLSDNRTRPGFRSPVQSGESAAAIGQANLNHVSSGGSSAPASAPPKSTANVTAGSGPYHDWALFSADYKEMMSNLRIFVYPEAAPTAPPSPFHSIFLPQPEAFKNPKLGNYFSEHAFKVALLRSPLVTKHPDQANFFYMPFSINAMRNHPQVHSASSISDFIAQYTTNVSSRFPYWNASGGADHFYVYCHSIGREAASKHRALHNNAIQITCSSSYFQRLYTTHKDIALPQIWPRQQEQDLASCQPPEFNSRNKLIFFAGRAQNSLIRQRILDAWSNDTSLAVSSGVGSSLQYEEGFKRSKFCLHIKGYEVNTARISDAIHYGCIPVLISNYYDLPLADVLDWKEFSIVIQEADFKQLKQILLSISQQRYQRLYSNLCLIRKHFTWHATPTSFDAFYMTAYQLWLRRGLIRLTK
ncbi:OLC1v1028796C1 [Oldenlandia corymbosa var. corymbosa]|uniref:OLC1v1028796C1 n=1 Tax=Oldenlandia corymbosa var. corymbosa TaxID=529605 RepID=A0AAV1CE58_OLDCO|nr:OLC1v1028796C1 [Oldenlandia corymbosa var. corymbosa]